MSDEEMVLVKDLIEAAEYTYKHHDSDDIHDLKTAVFAIKEHLCCACETNNRHH